MIHGRIAVVEDDPLIRSMIRINLERDGHTVEEFGDAESLVRVLSQERFDAIMLDIMLPGEDGDRALIRIRDAGHSCPVMMVSARAESGIKVESLDNGADDYVSKPFDMEELVARVRSLIRRSRAEPVVPADDLLRINRSVVDLQTREARTPAGIFILTEKECKLLRLFSARSGRVLSRSDILEEVWGMDVFPTPRTVDNFVLRFRKLFEDDPERPRHFVTVRAAGYRYVARPD